MLNSASLCSHCFNSSGWMPKHKSNWPVPPCGGCRQVLAEFAQDLPILMVNTAGDRLYVSLAELLPHRFDGSDLK